MVRILQRFGRVEDLVREGEAGKGPKMKCEVVMSPGEGVRVGFWDAEEGGKAGEGE